jgi:hypothetical protein
MICVGVNKAVLEVPGNWMAPPAQIAATEKVAAILAEVDPGRADAYHSAAARRKAAVREAGTAQAKPLAAGGVGRVTVLANDMQADLVRWAGFQEAPLMKGVTESMAGRAAVFSLLPLSLVESPRVTLRRGGFPEVLARPATAPIWFSSYVQTYLERDVRAISSIRDLAPSGGF